MTDKFRFIEKCLAGEAERLHLRYLVVFGSHAEGSAGPYSDLDVAVKVGRRLKLRERGLIHSALSKCAGNRLDLVFLDDWNPIVAWEALVKGILIYSCGVECIQEYYWDKAKAIDEVADLEPVIKLFRRETRHALARSYSQDG